MARSASDANCESYMTECKSKYNYYNNIKFKLLHCGKDDEEYQKYLLMKNKYPSCLNGKCKFVEMCGSILSATTAFSLAISVTADYKMNWGIAAKFKQKFGIKLFKEQKAQTGGLAFIKHRPTGRFIYYLVVAPICYAKPTYYTIWMSLQKLKANVLKFGIKRIAMTRIGCTDGITWDFVKPMIEYTFRDVSIEIQAYEGKSPCALDHNIEDCFCYGYNLLPPEMGRFDYSPRAMLGGNELNYIHELKKNKYEYYGRQTRQEGFAEYSSSFGRRYFWENNSQITYGTQGEHSAYNAFNTQSGAEGGCTLAEATNRGTQKEEEEDVYHKYCIKVGNDYYVKYSTGDAANDYYGALY